MFLPHTHPLDYFMPFIKFLRSDVFHSFSGLNPREVYGPDGVPPIVHKKLCLRANTWPGHTFPPLPINFYLSFLLHAYVQPVPKKGDRSNPSTYPLIALVSRLSKAFKTTLNRKFLKHLSSFNLLSDHQHGFRRGRSTGNLLTFLTDSWLSSLSRFGETFAVALDISKAFDSLAQSFAF